MSKVDKKGNVRTMAPQRFISSQTNSWQGWECSIGLEQIVINMHGDIQRGWCSVGGKVGSINDKKVSFPTKPVVCDKSFCHCNLDIMCSKKKPGMDQ